MKKFKVVPGMSYEPHDESNIMNDDNCFYFGGEVYLFEDKDDMGREISRTSKDIEYYSSQIELLNTYISKIKELLTKTL